MKHHSELFILTCLPYSFTYLNLSFSRKFAFEKAYCLYRLNRSEEALELINEEPNPAQSFKELKAQILYKLER